MLGYVLVSYGPKPTGPVYKIKAASQQIRNLHYLARRIPNSPSLSLCYDYARTVKSLRSLPVLKQELERAKKLDGAILVDSYSRLFAKCHSEESKKQLLNDLWDYSENIIDVQTRKKLDEFSNALLAKIIMTPTPFKFVAGKAPKSKLSKKERQDQTRKATRASQIARAAAADRKAEELNNLKEELERDIGPVNFLSLAREANERGLTTTRNQDWSSSSVKRALQRLDNTPE